MSNSFIYNNNSIHDVALYYSSINIFDNKVEL